MSARSARRRRVTRARQLRRHPWRYAWPVRRSVALDRFSPAGAGLVLDHVPRAHGGPGPGLAGHRLGRAHADPGAHRLGQDAHRVPVGHRPAGHHRRRPRRQRRTRLLYISPLRALAVDVEKNLRAPLQGIGLAAERLGPAVHRADRRHAHRRHAGRRAPAARPPPARPAHHHARVALPDAHVGGPRDAARRRGRHHRRDPRPGPHQAGRPPGSVARAARGAVRAPAPAHRPVGHPAPARRDRPLPRRLRGRPGRPRPVTIVDAGVRKPLEIEVVVPVEDMGALGEVLDEPRQRPGRPPARPARASGRPCTPASWPSCSAHRSTIIFCNARRLAERLATRLNELAEAERRRGRAPPASWSRPTTARCRASGACVIEDELKRGELHGPRRHLQPRARHRHGRRRPRHPGRVAGRGRRGLQRIGRAGHPVGEPSRGKLFPKHRADLVEAAVVVQRMHDGPHRAHPLPPQPARRAGPADRGHGRARRVVGRRAGRPRAPAAPPTPS